MSHAAPTEVTAKAKRRTFTAEYKQKILQEADACDGARPIGALLRREGLYSSHLLEWRGLRDARRARGARRRRSAARRPRSRTRCAQKLAEKERENARLKAENAKLQLICDVQKKVSLLLGVTLPTIPDDDESTGSPRERRHRARAAGRHRGRVRDARRRARDVLPLARAARVCGTASVAAAHALGR